MFNTDHIFAQLGINQYNKPEWLRIGDICDAKITENEILLVSTTPMGDNKIIWQLMNAIKNHDNITIARTKNNRLKIVFLPFIGGNNTQLFLQQLGKIVQFLQTPSTINPGSL